MGISKPKDEYAEKLKKERKKAVAKPVKEKPKIKEIVRVAGTELDGSKPLIQALKGIRGVGHAMAKAVCELAEMDPKARLGSLSEKEIKKLEDVMMHPTKYGAPAWLVNRQKDLLTGQDKHLIGAELAVQQKFDVQRYIDLRTYRGVRHMYGLPVRGQRTKSSFRKGRTVGVIKKEVRLRLEKEKRKT
jgi:small subunit ribosomal protein S13